MQVHAAMGNRAGVAREFQRLSQILKEEMGVSPLPETQKLSARLMGPA
jgi:DNA-binding SARP family transcriptional activator